MFHEYYEHREGDNPPAGDPFLPDGRAVRGWRDSGRELHVVRTNSRSLYDKVWGMPWWGTILAGPGLFASGHRLKAVTSGSMAETTYLNGGKGMSESQRRAHTKSGFVAPSLVIQMYQSAGLWYVQPIGGLGQWGVAKLSVMQRNPNFLKGVRLNTASVFIPLIRAVSNAHFER